MSELWRGGIVQQVDEAWLDVGHRGLGKSEWAFGLKFEVGNNTDEEKRSEGERRRKEGETMDAGWMGVRSAACGQDGEEEKEDEEQTKTRLGLESSTNLLR